MMQITTTYDWLHAPGHYSATIEVKVVVDGRRGRCRKLLTVNELADPRGLLVYVVRWINLVTQWAIAKAMAAEQPA